MNPIMMDSDMIFVIKILLVEILEVDIITVLHFPGDLTDPPTVIVEGVHYLVHVEKGGLHLRRLRPDLIEWNVLRQWGEKVVCHQILVLNYVDIAGDQLTHHRRLVVGSHEAFIVARHLHHIANSTYKLQFHSSYNDLKALSKPSAAAMGTPETSREPCPDRILDNVGGAFDCSMVYICQKEDMWNSIIAGAATGGAPLESSPSPIASSWFEGLFGGNKEEEKKNNGVKTEILESFDSPIPPTFDLK
nr:mitochondrial import inner membrane translocase subunit TIM17-2-like [Ipomoea batatas]